MPDTSPPSDPGALPSVRDFWDAQSVRYDEDPDHGLRDPAAREAWRAHLTRWLPEPPATVLDLGCGTGSLSLLALEAGHRVHGVDLSPAMVAEATAKCAGLDATFTVGDAADPPAPAPVDAVLARHLLWTLPDPAAALAAWATQLAPGGLLLVDEVDRIHTTQPALRGYLGTAAALLAARGHALEIGPRLHRLPDPPGLARRHDRAVPLAPPAARAAELVAQNLAVWRADAVRSGGAARAELDRLAGELATVAAGQAEGTIAWELRQLAFRRA